MAQEIAGDAPWLATEPPPDPAPLTVSGKYAVKVAVTDCA
jgi:hypothetical protein